MDYNKLTKPALYTIRVTVTTETELDVITEIKDEEEYYKSQVIKGESRYEVIDNDGEQISFGEDVRNQQPKIYLVSRHLEPSVIEYVGQTTQEFSNRISNGIRKHGYEWARKSKRYDVLVWNLPINFEPRQCRYFLDSVEAELTLLVRLLQKDWPLSQASITFRQLIKNETGDAPRYIAAKMIEHYYEYLNEHPKAAEKKVLDKEFKDGKGIIDRIVSIG
ncbi:hypothetical protein [Vibrio owensii]|uniref:hypothetical protein n=1 Tax=Vibrio owensii TaxID=696485 RepID=UPI004068D447